MNATDVLDLVSVAMAIGSMALAWYFVATYRHEPWRETAAGQHLMKFTTGIAVVCTWAVVGVVLRVRFGLPDWLELGLGIARLLTFAWLAWVLWERVSLLRMSIRERRINTDPEPPEPITEGTDHD
jgi:hypothetical protein